MSVSSPEDHSHHRKKRVGKACDSCRIKKTKCDGRKPCTRCIADNKLCAFTDKKKLKDKAHPTGYIELLETRIDLLTRSLSKVVTMAEPHLPFLQQIIEKAKMDHVELTPVGSDDDALSPPSNIPINEVVSYLISDLNLMGDESSSKMFDYAQLERKINTRPPHGKAATESREISPLDQSSDKPSNFSESSQFSGHARAPSPPVASRSADTSNNGLPEQKSLFSRYSSAPPSRSSSLHSLQSNSADAILPGPPSFVSNGSNSNFILGRPVGQETMANYGPFSYSSIENHGPIKYSPLDSVEEFPSSQSLGQSTMSTSPSSISSISVKLESQSFEDHHRHGVAGPRRSQSTNSHISSFSMRRKNSGHVHKPHTALGHSPQLLSAQVPPSAVNFTSFSDYRASTSFSEVPSAFSGQIQAPFEFDNALSYNEPPSKVTESIPSFLDGEDLAMTNPFLSSINYR